MIAKTTRTTLIIAMLSLVGLAVPAGVSQTVFAQTIADEAVSGTPLEGFFDESQEIDQDQDPQQEQDQDPQPDQDQQQEQGQQQEQESSQDETNTQNANV